MSDLKIVFVERFSRTLLGFIKEPLLNEKKWIMWLLLWKRIIIMSLAQPFWQFLIGQLLIILIDQPNNTDKPKQHKHQVGDFVRVPDERNFYRNGYRAIGLENF